MPASAFNPFDSFAGRLAKQAEIARQSTRPATSGAVAATAPTTAAAPAEPVAPLAAGDDAPASGGPVGQGNHVVRGGECMDSIATKTGFFWQTLWDLPANAPLKEARQNPNVLLDGDRLTIPPKRRKDEPGATELVHRFRRRGMPAKLRMRIMEDDEPRAGERYLLTIDGKLKSGNLDGQGMLDVPIPPTAKRVTLQVGNDKPIDLPLGSVDPISEVSGIQGRLNNLGFDAGPVDNKLGPRTAGAIRKFQQQNKLTVTGKPDSETRQKLLEAHGT